MVLIGGAGQLLLAITLLTAPPIQGTAQEHTPAIRRLAATALLAAQEYRIGVVDGRVVNAPEVEEAQLFLGEARRSAALLPLPENRRVTAEIDSILRLVGATAEPDSVTARVQRLTGGLAQGFGVSLEDIPAHTPSLARGAEVYAANCASCHGARGGGDGPAALGLDPVPSDLTDAQLLADASPLDFYRRITIGVAGTAMPAFETRLSAEDRWAAAVYATLLRLPDAHGAVPPALRSFANTARLSDAELASALGGEAAGGSAMAQVAAVRGYQSTDAADAAGPVFALVRAQIDSAYALALAGQAEAASTAAFDAYMTFEQVERGVRAKNPRLANELEAAFAALRTRAAGGAARSELDGIRTNLASGLENAQRTIADAPSRLNLFVQSLVLLLREGLEAILIVGALMTFLVKTGNAARKRDINIGVGAALAASLLTAVVIETLFALTLAQQEAIEGFTMVSATLVLFYVSYWLLSKMEVVKWTHFVKSKVSDAVSSGSALALATVAFLAVYREGFETVLFYKALFLSGGEGAAAPIVAGAVVASVALVGVYVAINRFGVRLPLRPFFAVTSAFLYYMAFVFAGQGIAELQEGGIVSTTYLQWAPRAPALGIYPTLETLAAQGILVALALVALVWIFLVEPRRLRVTSVMVPEPTPVMAAGSETGAPAPAPTLLAREVVRELGRSLDRMEADLGEMRAEVERMRRRLSGVRVESARRR